jgi:hypothetical protein
MPADLRRGGEPIRNFVRYRIGAPPITAALMRGEA